MTTTSPALPPNGTVPPARRLLRSAALALLLLAGCSGPTVGLTVPDIVIPAQSSVGTICYVPGDESAPRRFASATYRAEGTFLSDSLLAPDSVVIRIYGRTEPPATPCVGNSGGATDVPLSEEITLPLGEETPVEVGGSEHGTELADLISRPSYWIGAEIRGGYGLASNEEIRLEQGRISLAIW